MLAQHSREEPLTPTLSPQERGEGEASYALPPDSLRVWAICILA
jgi:hypothetical protein